MYQFEERKAENQHEVKSKSKPENIAFLSDI